MKESITKQRKWNLIAGGSDPANDVVSAELCQGIEDAMRHAYAKMQWLGRRKPGVRAHIIDPVMPPQPVSDTPRTDEISNASGNSWMNGNLCRQLERELNAANERIKLLEDSYAAKDAQLSNLLNICRANGIDVSSQDLIHGKEAKL